MVDKTDAALALSTAALMPALFSASMPPAAELRARVDTGHDSAALRAATLSAVLTVSIVGAVTGSRTVLLAGGATILGLAALYAHAVEVTP